jgi:tRNA dimethylallyltransferase
LEDNKRKKVLAILGPTGVGKTGLGIKLCNGLKGEIISCDSRQIYRDLDIGTAKPSKLELSQARHHLIDIIDVGDTFSAFLFRKKAVEIIEDIFGRGLQPVVIGGTGLYYRALNEGLFETPSADQQLRESLECEAEEFGNEYLKEKLKKLDPKAAEKISKSDRFRLIRALEIQMSTGKLKSELEESGVYPEKVYDFLTVGLNLQRKVLYQRINDRVDQMLAAGWLDETRQLINLSKINSRNISKLMGYNNLYEHIKGRMAYNDCVEKIKQSHRNYAKRQITWFKRVKGLRWFKADDTALIEKIMELFNQQ